MVVYRVLSCVELIPEVLITDFELTVMNAFCFQFSTIVIIGFYFHIGQNLFKKVVVVYLKEQSWRGIGAN
jgi:hypothetical protein